MKHGTTTPVSISFMAKSSLVALSVLMAIAVPISMTPQTHADKYDDQINAIQKEIDQYESQAAAMRGQAETYQQKLTSLNIEKSQIQAQLDISQAQYNKLVDQIVQTEKDIKTNQDGLGEIIAHMYVDDSISPLEMLASSKNIGDYVDKQEFRETIRDQLSIKINTVKTLKQDLETQKNDVTKVLANQKNSRDALATKEAEQQNLINETRGQESAYQALSESQKVKQAQVRDQQQAAIAAAYQASSGGGTVISSGQVGDYPWNNTNCSMGGPGGYYSYGGSDGNGGDGRGYGCRQCASYAAWRVAKETGIYPLRWGNATNFPSSARAAGYSTGTSPRAGSLAVMHNGAEGHVAWVESENGDGTIIVSQYNYNYGAGFGMYSKMSLSSSAFQEYVYIK